jgi:hypothetical protein
VFWYADEDEDHLRDPSSRPHTCPTRTAPTVEQAVWLRRERGQDCPGPSWGCWPAPSAGSCAATRCPICASVIRLTGEAIRSSKRTMVRYEGDHPGELGHVEVNDRAHPRSIVVMPCPAK